ncbi:MAG: cation diffusion facilitator family transporter [Oribacterium sp.]|nr:cation diffusion facilitator family transporter [Oribacterium sp.]
MENHGEVEEAVTYTSTDRDSKLVDTSSSMTRDAKIIRTSIIGIIANIFLAGFKFFVGSISGSISITLDAVNNLSDSMSSVITILGTKLSQKPADKKHPYGYGRIEYLSATIIAVIVLYAGITSLKESVTKIIYPEAASYTTVAFIVLAVGIIVKLLLSRYFIAVGKSVDSKSLVASGSDAGFDAILSTSVLLAALLLRFTGVNLEAFVGTVISVIIIKSGFEMLQDAVGDILGARLSPELTKSIKKTIAEHDKVYGAFDLSLHAYGPSKLEGSVHIEVPEDMEVHALEQLQTEIAMDIYEKFGVILTGISVYSHNMTSETATGIRAEVRKLLSEYKDVLQMHGFYLDEERNSMKFDIIISFDTPAEKRQEEYKEICTRIQEKYPDYTVRINLDADISQ